MGLGRQGGGEKGKSGRNKKGTDRVEICLHLCMCYVCTLLYHSSVVYACLYYFAVQP